MEELKNIIQLLEQIPQPGFLVRENRITHVNQAAGALMLTPGQEFDLLCDIDWEDYDAACEGQLCLSLSIGGTAHQAAITRLEDADLILLDTPQMQEEFRSMALVSMELRGPLMQAISAAQKLPADARMNQSLMQMLRLVSNMADIGRYAASVRMELRDVDSFLLELFEKAQALTTSRISISFHGMNHPVFSLIDPEQLDRAVWIILSNCIKFMPEGGTISAALTRRGNLLRLTVEDSGSGIAAQVRATLFQRYLRQPGIEDSRYGLGLGLAIVRTAAVNHGGTVLISPTSSGGTKVALTLPIRQEGNTALHSPIFRPDYTGGWDHALVELSDCPLPDLYTDL